MKPEQFIREFGIERAKELINDPLHPKMTHVSDDGRHWVNEHNKNLDENIRKQLPRLMRLDDLKRLVESVEIIQFWHGIEWCKGLVEDYKEEPIHKESYGHRIIQAIADYETIYGGSHA
ncbi:hypothetical protein [Acinetobacter pittii]|uniref:hypothetical protein n=1 Tax=Acinetobacter pittii TaxID=48296 RepID=UPI00192C73BF|nr:hypothetical protein [Acinetobacter pittii]